MFEIEVRGDGVNWRFVMDFPVEFAAARKASWIVKRQGISENDVRIKLDGKVIC